VRDDPKALDRALCHEMVHAYLYATGEEHTVHGPAFQAVLQRLALEHAFEGIAADPATRTALRAWLDAESARLDVEPAGVAAGVGMAVRVHPVRMAKVAIVSVRIRVSSEFGDE